MYFEGSAAELWRTFVAFSVAYLCANASLHSFVTHLTCPLLHTLMRSQTRNGFPCVPAEQTFEEHAFAEESPSGSLPEESWKKGEAGRRNYLAFCAIAIPTSLHSRYMPRRRPSPSLGRRRLVLLQAWLALSSCNVKLELQRAALLTALALNSCDFRAGAAALCCFASSFCFRYLLICVFPLRTCVARTAVTYLRKRIRAASRVKTAWVEASRLPAGLADPNHQILVKLLGF